MTLTWSSTVTSIPRYTPLFLQITNYPPPPPTFTEQVTIFYLYVKVPDMGRWCNRHLKINQLYVQTREPWDAPPGDKDPQEYRPLYFMSRQVHNITSDTPHALYPFSLNLAIYIYMTLFFTLFHALLDNLIT